MAVKTIDEVFRDHVVDGVSSSGAWKPIKADIRDTLNAGLPSSIYKVADIAALKAIDASATDTVYVIDANKAGVWMRVAASDYTSLITADTANGIIVKSTEDTTYAYLRIFEGNPRLAWFGGAASLADNASAVTAAAKACTVAGHRFIECEGDIACTTTVAKADVADVTFLGTGKLTGVPFKRMIPPYAPAPGFVASDDVVPGSHLARFNRAAKPRVVLVGDSLSANTTINGINGDRMDLFYDCFKAAITRQFPNRPVEILTRGIGSTGFNHFSQVPTNWASVAWYDDDEKIWSEYVEELEPDLVVLHWGMNHTQTLPAVWIKLVVDEINSWAKRPDILFVTPMVPRIAYSEWTADEIAGRESVAGLVRSYAKYYGFGVIDVNRMMMMVRDGFDARSFSMPSDYQDITPVELLGSWYSTPVGKCRAYRLAMELDTSAWTDGGGETINLRFGTGIAANQTDPGGALVGIRKGSGGKWQVSFIQGDQFSSIIVNYADTAAPTTTNASELFRIEYYDGWMTISMSDNPYVDPIWAGRVVAKGGEFVPTLAIAGTNANLTSTRWTYGVAMPVMPVETDTRLWADDDWINQSDINHPTSLMSRTVYRPVISALRFRSDSPSRVVSKSTGVGQTAANTTATDLMSYTLPANSLAVGNRLRIRAAGTTAANGNTKTIKLYYGATLVGTASGTYSALAWIIDTEIEITATAIAEYYTRLVISGGTLARVSGSTDSIAADIVVRCEGTNGTASAGDIVCQGLLVEILDR